MLAIEQQPLYKNKLVLSIAAVTLGFLMTAAVVRVLNPESTRQANQSTSERRSSLLLPINASSSETASEGGSSGTSGSGSASAGTAGRSDGTSLWTTQRSAPAAGSNQTAAQPTQTASATPTTGSSSQPAATPPVVNPENDSDGGLFGIGIQMPLVPGL